MGVPIGVRSRRQAGVGFINLFKYLQIIAEDICEPIQPKYLRQSPSERTGAPTFQGSRAVMWTSGTGNPRWLRLEILTVRCLAIGQSRNHRDCRAKALASTMPGYFVYTREHWQQRAREMRALAARVQGRDAQDTMLRIAQHYEQLAARDEGPVKTAPLEGAPKAASYARIRAGTA
jgi:hypothetical protein